MNGACERQDFLLLSFVLLSFLLLLPLVLCVLVLFRSSCTNRGSVSPSLTDGVIATATDVQTLIMMSFVVSNFFDQSKNAGQVRGPALV